MMIMDDHKGSNANRWLEEYNENKQAIIQVPEVSVARVFTISSMSSKSTIFDVFETDRM